MTLAELKRIEGALRQAYLDAGGKLNAHDSNHNSCPICGDATGFSLFMEKEQARWKCHAKCGGAGGSIIDLVAQIHKLDTKAACKLALQKYGGGTSGRRIAESAPGASGTQDKATAAATVRRQAKGKLHLTVDCAIDAQLYGLRQRSDVREPAFIHKWIYTDTAGLPVFEVARFDYTKDGERRKEFRPIHREANGWRAGLGPWGREKKAPLYNLRALTTAAADATLHVAEGEKCADAVIALGLLATTSQGGSGRAAESDWTPAARFKRVVIWQDFDAPNPKTGVIAGRVYVQAVAELVTAIAAAAGTECACIIVDLSDYALPEGGDVYDLIAAWRQEGKDDAAVLAGLEHTAAEHGQRWFKVAEIAYPGQPAPFVDGAREGERPELRNFDWQEYKKTLDNGEEKVTRKARAASIHVIRGRMLAISGKWPARIQAPGAREPLLFVDNASGSWRWLQKTDQFQAWLQELADLRFNAKQDFCQTNYTRCGDLFHSVGAGGDVAEYVGVSTRPHEPLMPGHYYRWRPPAGYVPDGKKLAGLLAFFPNAKDPVSRAVMAAALLCPGWGGPYGKKPAFVIEAPDRGCGKSTFAKAIGRIWGGMVQLEVGQRNEDRWLERLLAPSALQKQVVLLDNVKGTLSNSTLEAMISDDWLNGHRLYSGDSSRPNLCTWLITGNGMRLSRDMAQRSFFVDLTLPAYCSDWDKNFMHYVVDNADFMVADAIHILQTARALTTLGLNDRFSLFCGDVLVPACTHPALAAWVGADVQTVLQQNRARRDLCDEEIEEAERFVKGLLQRVCADACLVYHGKEAKLGPGVECFAVRGDEGIVYCITCDPLDSVFIPAEKMQEHWRAIFDKRLSTKQVAHIIKGHVEAGRVCGVDARHTERGNGWLIAERLLREYVEGVRARLRPASTAPVADSGGGVSGGSGVGAPGARIGHNLS